MHILPSPPIKPFERLHVSDGLLINAERWRRAHEYHRDRQNVHYQSLNQPGIVWGLGVCVIPAPQDVPAQYRDGRWVQVQPGIAIDAMGNPIVVPQPIEFHVASNPLEGEPLITYLVVSYVDPDQLQRQATSEMVQETFRIDERNTPPDAMEVELCRIVLQPGFERIQAATNVFEPEYQALDLRYRVQAQARSQAMVRVATLAATEAIPANPQTAQLNENAIDLLRSLKALYPALQGAEPMSQVNLQAIVDLTACDLLLLTGQQSHALSDAMVDTVRQFLEGGGVVLVEVSTQGSKLEELGTIQQQLAAAIARLNIGASNPAESNVSLSELTELRSSLETELEAINLALQQQINQQVQNFEQVAQQLGTPLVTWENLPRHHPLRSQPFLFGAAPSVNEQPIKFLVGGGLIVVLGQLSAAWGLGDLTMTRDTIRAAQEMGINLLHYAQRRKQMTQLQQVNSQ
ncbi:hypothetical protein ACN4EK_20590 [Pantanalinema rosaneae CENA516]|uniref:hypothetical protein n=1 Tax=Pantanalinema rosaneae TaxID=1620701 RepID=UPI003D6FF24B